MSDATQSSTRSTAEGPGDGDRGPDWGEVIDEVASCGRSMVDRFSERAKQNLQLVREGRYTVTSWLDDVSWFWEGVAEDTRNAVDTFRNRGSAS